MWQDGAHRGWPALEFCVCSSSGPHMHLKAVWTAIVKKERNTTRSVGQRDEEMASHLCC